MYILMHEMCIGIIIIFAEQQKLKIKEDKTMAYNAIDIAKKLIIRAVHAKQHETLTNMRLQKLLYYQQGYHLAVFNEPLFNEDIEAWMYGPVVPCVYELYKKNGDMGIMPHEGEMEVELSEDEENLFSKVFNAYSEYSAYGLMNMTHAETPWKSVKPKKGSIITKQAMTDFFKTKINA